LLAGGTVTGVMPPALVEREIQHTGLTEWQTVETMHERKTKMAQMWDGFVALPGGAGTLEEIFEQWTWAQLGIHYKPCGFLLGFDTAPAAILDAFHAYAPPAAKWQARTAIRKRTWTPSSREIAEELSCSIRPGSPVFLGTFTAAGGQRKRVPRRGRFVPCGTAGSYRGRFRNRRCALA
jgi:hypothetical protein